MAVKSALQVAQKWSRNLQGAGEAIRQGVDAVTESPATKAIRQQDVMVQNFTQSVASGKWARNLAKVSLAEWQEAFKTYGIPRITAGAAKGLPKFEQFYAQFGPWLEQGLNKLKAMPRGNLETNINRAVTMIRHNSEFKRN